MSPPCSSALLLVSLDSLAPPHHLAQVIKNATNATSDKLVIVVFSRLFNRFRGNGGEDISVDSREDTSQGSLDSPTEINPRPRRLSRLSGYPPTHQFHPIQRLLTYMYVQATRVAHSLDRITMSVDVLLRGLDEGLGEEIGRGMEVIYRVGGDCIPTALPASISSLRQHWLLPGDSTADALSDPPPPSSPSTSVNPPSSSPANATASAETDPAIVTLPPYFPVVALGGTFDHLHAGHKILLSMAAYIAGEKVIVGVTDSSLLTNKTHFSHLESLSTRIACVRTFLEAFRPGLTYDLVPLKDVLGPTGWDANIQALVVSRETRNGGEMIAKHRAEHNLPPLYTFVIDVISASEMSLESEDVEVLKVEKMSSTGIRAWIVERKEREKTEREKEAMEK